MFQLPSTTFRFFVILSTIASAIVWIENSANCQRINVGYADGPAIRGTNMAMPLPLGNPGYGRPLQQPRMIHPSASPYLFQSETANNVIYPSANTSASFPVTSVVKV